MIARRQRNRFIGTAVLVVIVFHFAYQVEEGWRECTDCGSRYGFRDRKVFMLSFPSSKVSHGNHQDFKPHGKRDLDRRVVDRRYFGGWLCICPCSNGTFGIVRDASDHGE